MWNRSWLIAAATAIFHWGLYLAFTCNVGGRELIAGAIVTVMATVAAVLYARVGKIQFAFRWRDVMQAWRLPWDVVNGTGQVLLAIWAQLFYRDGAPSRLVAVQFDGGPLGDPKERGRRALAVTYTTATPNSIVLGMVPPQRLMLYHQIIPQAVPAMMLKLGARP